MGFRHVAQAGLEFLGSSGLPEALASQSAGITEQFTKVGECTAGRSCCGPGKDCTFAHKNHKDPSPSAVVALLSH
ncbi:hypothetical protein AAY473_016511 [Plecturocebus cupreus]